MPCLQVCSLPKLHHAFHQADIIIQATSASLGHQGKEFVSSIPFRALPAHATLIDLVYRPRNTPFLQAAATYGLKTISGEGMLLHQGALSLEYWTNKKAPIAHMKKALDEAEINHEKPIY